MNFEQSSNGSLNHHKRLQTFLYVFAIIILSVSCSSEKTPEIIAADFISLCETAVSKRDARSLRNVISDDYSDNKGRTKKDIAAIASGYLLRNRKIYVFSILDQVFQTEQNNLSVTVLVALAGKPVTDRTILLSMNADMYWFDLVLGQERDGWKLFSATWRQALVEDFL